MKISKNESGFGVVEILLAIVVIAMLGGVGWYAYRSVRKSDSSNTQAGPTNQQSTPSNQSEAKLEKYCDPIEKSCISFGNDWDKKTSSFEQEGTERTSLVLENKANRKLTIDFKPYVYGVGGDYSDIQTTITSIQKVLPESTLYIVKGVFRQQEIKDAKLVKQYYRALLGVGSERYVKDGDLKVGKTNHGGSLFLLQYDVKSSKKGAFGQLTASPGKEFDSENQAMEWFNSDELKEAETVLRTLELN